MNNGTRKGGQPDAMRILTRRPGLEDLWQVHFSLAERPGIHRARAVHRQSRRRSSRMRCRSRRCRRRPGAAAPPPPAHNGPAYWIKVSAQTDGSFTVTNARNGFSKTYKAVKR